MSENAPNSAEQIIDPSTIPVGMSTQVLQNRQGESVWMPAYNNGESTTLLVAVTDDARWQKRVGMLREQGIPCHLLPAKGDTYIPEEFAFASNTLQETPLETSSPYVRGPRAVEAIVFDPSSPKSLLDVMIRTGHDTSQLRQARRDALQGNPNDIVAILANCIEAAQSADVEAETGGKGVYSTVYGNSISSTHQFVEDLAHKGLESWGYRTIERMHQAGVDQELVQLFAQNPEQAQAIATAAWQESIAAAHTHNTDAKQKGVYTEIHELGGVMIVLPAIASTAYETHDSNIGYVDVTGQGHTLAEIYANGAYGAGSERPINKTVFDSTVARLARGLGMSQCGPRTLQRRCLTTFDANGQPTIHLRDEDPHSGNHNKMTNEEVLDALRAENINAVLKQSDKVTISLNPETNSQTEVFINKVPNMQEPRSLNDQPIGVLVHIGEAGQHKLVWTTGYARWHEDIRTAYQEGSEAGLPTIQIGGKSFAVKADYLRVPSSEYGKTDSLLLWNFIGDPEVFKQHALSVAAMVKQSERAFAKQDASAGGASSKPIRSEIAVTDPKTKKITTINIKLA
ncbi:MAG: hypothetical protein WAQ24_04640 [Candidatus Saccharimonadales bacterium]